ncbi:MAG: tonB-system energizer ExbB [Siculibacillus sp.]|nr:tonB-system energizer ExbB [Siculibacillus sp.]
MISVPRLPLFGVVASLVAFFSGSAAAAAPGDLSPLAMFLGADWVVKAVMGLLAAASVLSWTIFVAKLVELRAANRHIGETIELLGRTARLSEASEVFGHDHGPGRAMLDAVAREIELSGPQVDRLGLEERVASRLARIEATVASRISSGVGLVGTVGSIAPFVGLFGTVWGIMNSFVGIAESQTTNLAVVAPGIAEALFATAIGLVAAIPAVVLYNRLVRSVGLYRNAVADAGAAVRRILSRELDRAGPSRVVAAAE